MKFDNSRSSFDASRSYSGVRFQQGRVITDADLNEQADITDARTREADENIIGASGVPVSEGDAFKLSHSGGFQIGAGDMYVGGLRIRNGTTAELQAAQPYFNASAPSAGGPYAFYVEAWEEVFQEVQHDGIADPALGGTEPSVRLKPIWHVRYVTPPAGSDTRAEFEAAVASRFPASTVTLAVAATSTTFSTVGAYRSPENQHYRFEVHRETTSGTYRYKWSRENASTLLSGTVTDYTPNSSGVGVVTVGSLSETVDPDGAFAIGDIVEVIDMTRQRAETREQRAGALGEVTSTNSGLVITLIDTSEPVVLEQACLLRKWHGYGSWVSSAAATVTVENGLAVTLAGGTEARAGDYWSIVVRTATGQVLGSATARLPDGPTARYALLATASHDGSNWNFHDWRNRFRPLTTLNQAMFQKLSGDGQVQLPDFWVDKPLVVSVGAAGETVSWAVDTGDGFLADATSGGGPPTSGTATLTTTSNEAGVTAAWWLFPKEVERTRRQRRVLASWGDRTQVFIGSMPNDYDIWCTQFIALVGAGTQDCLQLNEQLIPGGNLVGFDIRLRYLYAAGTTDQLHWEMNPRTPAMTVYREPISAAGPIQSMWIDTAAGANLFPGGAGGARFVDFRIRFNPVHAADVGRFHIQLRARRYISGPPAVLVPGPVVHLFAYR